MQATIPHELIDNKPFFPHYAISENRDKVGVFDLRQCLKFSCRYLVCEDPSLNEHFDGDMEIAR
ncbi:hypothetical protein GOP47_0029452 [Adiantum capillus-veneris]|nr:hypothetical protein GOP47_0029452 [Adiantum capillus-veneris]